MFYRRLASLCFGFLFLATSTGVNAETLCGLSTAEGVSSLRRLDLETGSLQNSTLLVLPDQDHVASSVILPNGELIVVSNQVQFGVSTVHHLSTVGKTQSSLTLSGIFKRSVLQNLVLTTEGKLIGLISENFGIPPFNIFFIDALSGEISAIPQITLPPNQRFSNLTQCPNGTLYGTSQGGEGSTRFVQIDLEQGQILPLAKLTLKGRFLNSDLNSLACSPSGQLYAALDKTSSGRNRLFKVDPNLGFLEQIGSYNLEKIFFAP